MLRFPWTSSLICGTLVLKWFYWGRILRLTFVQIECNVIQLTVPSFTWCGYSTENSGSIALLLWLYDWYYDCSTPELHLSVWICSIPVWSLCKLANQPDQLSRKTLYFHNVTYLVYNDTIFRLIVSITKIPAFNAISSFFLLKRTERSWHQWRHSLCVDGLCLWRVLMMVLGNTS